MISNIRLAGAALGLIMAAPAFAVSSVTVETDFCVSVSDAAGCAFSGNISPANYLDAQNAYNALEPAKFDAPITLRYLASTDEPDFAALGGTYTGQDEPSGTWSLPGYAVEFLAVKAGTHFALFKFDPALSGGSWNTNSLTPFCPSGQPPCLSHLVFFGGAVPEPEAWAMLIAGFGLVGAVMRRRRKQAPALA